MNLSNAKEFVIITTKIKNSNLHLKSDIINHKNKENSFKLFCFFYSNQWEDKVKILSKIIFI